MRYLPLTPADRSEMLATIGAPSIDGFSEEGESLSELNAGSEQHGLKKHSHGNAPVVPEASRGERLKSFNLADFAPLTGREEDWRFTPLRRLGGLLDGPPASGELKVVASARC